MRILPTLALSASVMLGACQNPDGSLNVPGTVALGAGAAIAGLAIASASNDRPRHYRRHDGYYGRPHYGYGQGYGHSRHAHGYGERWRRW